MTYEEIKEVINLHAKLSKNKNNNKEILSFFERRIKKETNISISDIKLLLDIIDKIKTEHLKVTLKSVIEGKPFEKYVYLPTQPETKPFDPKPYWDLPVICSSYFKDNPCSVNSTSINKTKKEEFCGEKIK